MAALYDLPDEILLEILRGFCAIRSFEPQSEAFRFPKTEKGRQQENHTRQQALYALCLTSHRLHRLSLPILYSSSITCATRRGHKSLQLLHRTIVDPSDAVAQTKRPVEHVRYIENRLADYRGDSLQDDDSFQNGPLSAYLQLLADLVVRAPNLEHACIVSVEHDNVSLWNHVLDDSPTRPRQSLLKLEHLSVQIHTYPYSSASGVLKLGRMLKRLQSLPMLSDLRLSGATSNEELMLASPRDGILKLRRLDLAECNLEIVEVASLLRVCNRLQQFTCVWQFNRETPLGPGVLRAALPLCADTLEVLALDWRVVRDGLLSHSGTEMIGSLRKFKKLRLLEISELGFLSDNDSYLDVPEQDPECAMSDLLPASLEQLTLLYKGRNNEYASDVLEKASCLWQFSSDCKTSTPLLKNFCIKAAQTMSLPTLTEAFAKSGVRLQTEVDPVR